MWPPPAVAAHHEPAGQQAHRRRHRRDLRPALDQAAVHVDDDGALLIRRAEERVAAPGLVGFVDGGAGRVYRRVALDEGGGGDQDGHTTEDARNANRHEALRSGGAAPEPLEDGTCST